MSELARNDDGFGYAKEQQHRALQRLEALADGAVGKAFTSAAAPGTAEYVTALARMIARDLTALGFTVHDRASGTVPGGVWLAPAPESCGVIAAWSQDEASAALLGFEMHRELQRQMNLTAFEVLHTLGYPVELYHRGGAHVVTGFRSVLPGSAAPG